MPILSIKNDESGQWEEILALKGEPGRPGESGVYTGPDEPLNPAISVWIDTSSSNGSNLVLKVKNANNNTWTSIDNFQGEKGEQGPKGDSGVYVGNESPQDDSLIWIDPDETLEPLKIPSVLSTTGQSTEDTISQKVISNSFSNSIKGKKQGKVITINDVSPIIHSIKGIISNTNTVDTSNSNIYISNKNLLRPESVAFYQWYIFGQKENNIGKTLLEANKTYTLTFDNPIPQDFPNLQLVAISNPPEIFNVLTVPKAGDQVLTFSTNKITTNFYRLALIKTGKWLPAELFATQWQLEYGEKSSVYEAHEEKIYPILDNNIEIESITPPLTIYSDNLSLEFDIEYNRDLSLILKEQSDNIQKNNEILNKNTNDYLQLFHTIGGIGDSLISGTIGYMSNDQINYIDCLNYSWLTNLCRSSGIAHKLFSQGGLTTKTWLELKLNSLLMPENKCDAYYIALGTNDCSKQEYPLGKLTDNLASNSFYGYYNTIIEKILEVNPYAAIFCVSLYGEWPKAKEYSNAIQNIANNYSNCFYVPFAKNEILTINSTTDSNLVSQSHFTHLGYVIVGKIIKDLTLKIISENFNFFKFYGEHNNNNIPKGLSLVSDGLGGVNFIAQNNLIDTPLTITVGNSFADFLTINEALESITRNNFIYKSGGLKVEIKILSGTTIAEQISVIQQDLQFITITSEDAEVPVDSTGWTVQNLNAHDLRDDVAFFGGENAAKLPTIGCKFKLVTKGTTPAVGYFANRGSNGVILARCGFDGFNDGIIANNESSITAREAVLTHMTRWGIHARHNGEISARSADLSFSGSYAAYADRIADIDIRYAILDNANYCAIYSNNCSRVNANAARCFYGLGNDTKGLICASSISTINADKMDIQVIDHGNIFTVLDGSIIDAIGATTVGLKPEASRWGQTPGVRTKNGIIYDTEGVVSEGQLCVSDGLGGTKFIAIGDASKEAL